MRPDALIFDLDGTLWDTSETCAAAWNRVTRELGFAAREVSAGDMRNVAGLSHIDAVRLSAPAEMRNATLLFHKMRHPTQRNVRMRNFALRWIRGLFPQRPAAESDWAPRPPLESSVHAIGSRAFVALRLVPDLPDAAEDQTSAVDAPAPRVIAVDFTDATHFFTSLSRSVEDGGIFVATYERLAVGTRLAIWFELPAGSVLDARGEVRWIRDDPQLGHPGLGIAFSELAPEAYDAILDHCARHPPLYADA